MKNNKRIKRSFFLVISIVLCFVVSGTSVFAGTLSDSQKDSYYEQYLQIAEEVNELQLGSKVYVVPKAEISEEDWMTPEEFRVLAKNMSQTVCISNSIDNSSEISPMSTVSTSKTATVKNGSATATIKISGKFTTQYSSYHKRQLIEGVSSISSAKSSGTGTWKHIGSEYRIGDAGRTCTIYVSGKYTVATVSVDTVASAEFYCSATGEIR